MIHTRMAEEEARASGVTATSSHDSTGAGVTGNHYIATTDSKEPGTEHWPFGRIHAAIEAHALPSYDTFWSNQTFCRHVVDGLYRSDVELYVRVCSQPSLRTCAVFRDTCDAQLLRLRYLCGIDEARLHAR